MKNKKSGEYHIEPLETYRNRRCPNADGFEHVDTGSNSDMKILRRKMEKHDRLSIRHRL